MFQYPFFSKLPDKIDSLCDLPHSYALPVAQKCLDRINGEDEETIVPDSKGDQVLLASKLAAACKVINKINTIF